MNFSPITRRHFIKASSFGAIYALLPSCSSFITRKLAGDIPIYKEDLKIQHTSKLVNAVKSLKKHENYKTYGKGRNARKYSNLEEIFPIGQYDLNQLDPNSLIMINENFYTRTKVPSELKVDDLKKINVQGLVNNAGQWPIQNIIDASEDIGVTMMECAGNDKYSGYRLMSAARWSGVPIEKLFRGDNHLLGFSQIKDKATHVWINGFDKDNESQGKAGGVFGVKSYEGASWIFSIDELIKQKAFFATGMNGKELELDRGFPIRLMVPGYYGCTCIKWITEINFFIANEVTETTSQMREFSERTNQNGVPKLYIDHTPPHVEATAVPVKIERWEKKNGKPIYRVVGLMWGGQTLERPDLRITLKQSKENKIDKDFVEMPRRTNLLSWTHWFYWWEPKKEGNYSIHMNIENSEVSTNRLDQRYYRQAVKIQKV